MNKLAVILPIYKREEITSLCFEHLLYQSKRFGFDVFVVGSEGEKSENLVKKFGFNYVEFENNPLSEKLNAILKYVKGYDGVILMGSDNFLSDSIIELYKEIDCSIKAVYGFDDLHFYDVAANKLATKGSYNRNRKMTIGVGRLFTKSLIEASNSVLWDEYRNSGLDNCCAKRIDKLGGDHLFIPYDENFFILDVKHELNITNPCVINTCEVVVSNELLKDYLPNIYKKILDLKETINPKIIKNKLNPIKMKNQKTLKQNPLKEPTKVKIRVTKAVAGMQVGDTRSIAKKMANNAVKNGWAVIVQEKPVVVTKVVEAPKKVVTKEATPKKAKATKRNTTKNKK